MTDEKTKDQKKASGGNGIAMLLIGFVGGAFAWHYASKAMQNYGRNRSIDDRMNALDAVYANTIPGATQPRSDMQSFIIEEG